MAELFESLSAEDSDLLRHFGQDVELQPGDVLFAKGDLGDSLMEVREGEIEMIGKNDIVLGTSKAGEIFGEMSLLEGMPTRTVTARAKTRAIVSSYSSENLALLREAGDCNTAIQIKMNILKALCRKLRDREAEAYALESFRVGEIRTERAMGALLRNLPKEGFFGLFPKAHKLEAGKYLFLEDDRSDSFFVITEGKLEVLTGTLEMQLPLNRLVAPTVIGETGFFLQERRSASVRSITELSYYEFDKQYFGTLMAKNPKDVLAILEYLSRLVVHRIYAVEGD